MKHILALFLFVVCCLVVLWHVLPASHDRLWRADHARLPQVATTTDGYMLTDVRNWSYDPVTGSSTEESWIDVNLNPANLSEVYFILEPFGTWDGIAHTMLSFHFTSGEAYVVSVEARREVGEEYQALQAALWPTYEYLYVWTTERDMFGNSQYFAGDELYRFRLALDQSQRQFLLETMLTETMAVAQTPRWYNTLFANCTNVLADAVNEQQRGALPWHYARLLPGYSPQYLYQHQFIANTAPLEELFAQGHLSPHIDGAYVVTDPTAFSVALDQALVK